MIPPTANLEGVKTGGSDGSKNDTKDRLASFHALENSVYVVLVATETNMLVRYYFCSNEKVDVVSRQSFCMVVRTDETCHFFPIPTQSVHVHIY